MKKYHYEIAINLETLEDENLAEILFGATETVNFSLDTNNKLETNELLVIKVSNSLINIEITKISRLIFYCEENHLIEMDYSHAWNQLNRPQNTTDEVWYYCKANALKIISS